MDHHTVASVAIAGSCLDVLGSLYLAYDLLGGPHGPLRLLTRAVTYSILFRLGYGLGLGLIFGVASGMATGGGVGLVLASVSELLRLQPTKAKGKLTDRKAMRNLFLVVFIEILSLVR